MKLRLSQIELLQAVAASERGASVPDLAIQLGLDRSTLYERVARLQARGCIAPAYIGGVGNSTHFLRLTAAGERALSEQQGEVG